MPVKPPAHNAKQIKRNRKDYERQRGSARQRGYTASLDAYSKARLTMHPLCVRCEAKGRIVLAKLTDHIKPARWFPKLFWDGENHQSLCVACNKEKEIEDAEKYGAMGA